MTDEIVTRLREKYLGQLPICTEAADEIERLRALLQRWECGEMVLNQTVDLIEDLRTELMECRDQYQRLWAKQHRQKAQVMCDPHDPCEMCKELAYYND
jgi:hypothetical protein